MKNSILMHPSDAGAHDIYNMITFKDNIICANPTAKIISIWSLKDKRCTKSWSTEDSVWSLAITENGLLVSGHGNSNAILVWDMNGKLLKKLGEHKDTVNILQTVDNMFVSGGIDGQIKIWDVERGHIQTLFTNDISSIRALTITPKGFLVSVNHKGHMKIWNLLKKQENCLKTITDMGWVYTLASTSNGLVVAGGSPDGRDNLLMQVWDAEEGKCLQKNVIGHTKTINSLQTTQDGLVISSSDDRTMKLWDIQKDKSTCLNTLSLDLAVNVSAVNPSDYIYYDNTKHALECLDLSLLKKEEKNSQLSIKQYGQQLLYKPKEEHSNKSDQVKKLEEVKEFVKVKK